MNFGGKNFIVWFVFWLLMVFFVNGVIFINYWVDNWGLIMIFVCLECFILWIIVLILINWLIFFRFCMIVLWVVKWFILVYFFVSLFIVLLLFIIFICGRLWWLFILKLFGLCVGVIFIIFVLNFIFIYLFVMIGIFLLIKGRIIFLLISVW